MKPRFNEDELIFVDPLVPPEHKQFVIIQLNKTQAATLRQLLIEDGKKFLKALNPDWPTPITEMPKKARIFGVAVFKGEII